MAEKAIMTGLDASNLVELLLLTPHKAFAYITRVSAFNTSCTDHSYFDSRVMTDFAGWGQA